MRPPRRVNFLGSRSDARYILEADSMIVLGEQSRARLAKAHGLAAARLHLSYKEDPQPDEQNQREPHDENLSPEARLLRGFRVDDDLLLVEPAQKILGDGGCVGGELLTADQLAADVAILDGDFLDPAVVHLAHELAVGDIGRRRLLLLEHGDEQQDDHQDHDPQGHILVELLIHEFPRLRAALSTRPPGPALRSCRVFTDLPTFF